MPSLSILHGARNAQRNHFSDYSAISDITLSHLHHLVRRKARTLDVCNKTTEDEMLFEATFVPLTLECEEVPLTAKNQV